ncbi:antibiotic biosynthesis monooxygenase [bacterium]|nr:MAG: antibiotic biosynthesis monooxygenase [bacterium]
MQYVLIVHEVEDYTAWEKIFDEAASIRKDAGEISYQLLKFEEDANNVVHFSRWSSLQNAKEFFDSQRLVEIRKQAGVKSPKFIYLDEIETGIL